MTTIALPVLKSTVPRKHSSVVAELLEQQQDLSAVEQFARTFTPGRAAEPAQARFYRDVIPLGLPSEGTQYSFEVDLDSCTGCKACVTACHGLNGLDDTEAWRSVGMLVGGSTSLPVMQHVTGACHHCIEPACLDGCPVLAYEKDPVTGIVKHLDDQCIGCQYCVLKCPYDAPKYNARLGIVRKCDMCSGRLAAGEAPACVQACPTQAIRISVIDKADAEINAEANASLVGVPDPRYTIPTTSYKSAKPLPTNTMPADYRSIKPEHAHWSLILMLVLMQVSVGAYVSMQMLPRIGAAISSTFTRWHAMLALAFCLTAMSASIFHLGRPLYAFRAFLGLKKSWLSREVVSFGLFALVATLHTAAVMFGRADWFAPWVAPLGVAVLACSVMVYHDTRREFWNLRLSAPRFVLAAVILGSLCTLIAAGFSGDLLNVSPRGTVPWAVALVRLIAVATILKLAFEATIFMHLRTRFLSPMKRTATLLVSSFGNHSLLRFGASLIGGILLPMMLVEGGLGANLSPDGAAWTLVTAFVFCLIGEITERYLFFTAVVAPRMPGVVGS